MHHIVGATVGVTVGTPGVAEDTPGLGETDAAGASEAAGVWLGLTVGAGVGVGTVTFQFGLLVDAGVGKSASGIFFHCA